jgi:hypothetical protein
MNRDMEYDPLNVNTQAEPKPCCEHLRCKSLTYREDERPGLLHVEEGMGYWCLHTSRPVGPDGQYVTHRVCQAGRACHKPGLFGG